MNCKLCGGHLCNGAALDFGFSDRRRCCASLPSSSYLAKLLNAADWGLMHNGTLLVFSCSAMNLCISSAIKNKILKTASTSLQYKRHIEYSHLWLAAPSSIFSPNGHRMVVVPSFRNLTCIASCRSPSCNSICTCKNGTLTYLRLNKGVLVRRLLLFFYPKKMSIMSKSRNYKSNHHVELKYLQDQTLTFDTTNELLRG